MKNNLFTDIFNVSVKAQRIRQDENRRQRSIGFAISSIIYSLLMLALVVGLVFLVKVLTGDNSEALLLFLFIIVGIVACIGGALAMCIGAVVRLIAQFSLNRRLMGIIALVIFIASLAASVIVIIYFSV